MYPSLYPSLPILQPDVRNVVRGILPPGCRCGLLLTTGRLPGEPAARSPRSGSPGGNPYSLRGRFNWLSLAIASRPRALLSVYRRIRVPGCSGGVFTMRKCSSAAHASSNIVGVRVGSRTVALGHLDTKRGPLPHAGAPVRLPALVVPPLLLLPKGIAAGFKNFFVPTCRSASSAH